MISVAARTVAMPVARAAGSSATRIALPRRVSPDERGAWIRSPGWKCRWVACSRAGWGSGTRSARNRVPRQCAGAVRCTTAAQAAETEAAVETATQPEPGEAAETVEGEATEEA